jgi:hypothetical protein
MDSGRSVSAFVSTLRLGVTSAHVVAMAHLLWEFRREGCDVHPRGEICGPRGPEFKSRRFDQS